MAYIYQIKNDINNKIYVGKTEFDIQKRFKEHCHDAFKVKNEKRPLYSAMRKYGIEHFHITLIEETDNPEEREIYWIEKLSSFKNGYNATSGGDGKKYLDYDLIIKTYNKVKNIEQTAKICNVHRDSVAHILKEKNVPTLSGGEVTAKQKSIPIGMYDFNNNLLKTFPSYGEAARFLVKNGYSKGTVNSASSSLIRCINKNRRTAFGFVWKKL